MGEEGRPHARFVLLSFQHGPRLMSTPRALALSILTTLLVVPLGGCEQPSTSDVNRTEEGVLRLGSVEAVDTLTRAVSPSGRPLAIEGVRGLVDLQGVDATTAELQFVRRGRGTDAETARGVLDDLDITEAGSEDGYTYTLEKNGSAYATVDVTGTVPHTTDLTIDRTTGAVSIADMEGPVTVTHEHGPVSIQEAAGAVTVEVKNGDVEVHFASLPSDAESSLRTVNGDVTLRLPPDASTQISAETNVGAVRTRDLDFTEQNFAPRDAGGQYSAQLDGGTASIDVQTQNGSIFITAADTTQAASPGEEGEATGRETDEEPRPLTVPPSDTTVSPGTSSDTMTADTTGGEPDTSRADTTAADQ